MNNRILLWILILLCTQVQASRIGDKNLGWPGETLSGNPCWGKGQGYGPLDYLKSPRSKTNVVYSHHFTPQVEQLVRGQEGRLASDIDYTLRAVPNHHRALWSKSKLYLRETRKREVADILREERAEKGTPPPECYFNRAMKFAPEDTMVSAVYAIYLHRRDKFQDALQQYERAEADNPDNPELMYNIGLLHFDMKDYDSADKYAQKARKLGYPLRGLQRKLSRVRAEMEREETK